LFVHPVVQAYLVIDELVAYVHLYAPKLFKQRDAEHFDKGDIASPVQKHYDVFRADSVWIRRVKKRGNERLQKAVASRNGPRPLCGGGGNSTAL